MVQYGYRVSIEHSILLGANLHEWSPPHVSPVKTDIEPAEAKWTMPNFSTWSCSKNSWFPNFEVEQFVNESSNQILTASLLPSDY
jgi:hypothetical protein